MNKYLEKIAELSEKQKRELSSGYDVPWTHANLQGTAGLVGGGIAGGVIGNAIKGATKKHPGKGPAGMLIGGLGGAVAGAVHGYHSSKEHNERIDEALEGSDKEEAKRRLIAAGPRSGMHYLGGGLISAYQADKLNNKLNRLSQKD